MSDFIGSEVIGQGIQSIPASGSVLIQARNRDRARKQFVVSNLEASGSGNTIYICGTDGNEALPVFPQESKTLETDSPFRLKAAGTYSYVVGEVWFSWGADKFFQGGGPGAPAFGGGGGGGSESRSIPVTGVRQAQPF